MVSFFRELIFTEPEISASPVLEDRDLVWVIVRKSYYIKTGKLNERFTKMKLKVKKSLQC